jgi:hypothetical protein
VTCPVFSTSRRQPYRGFWRINSVSSFSCFKTGELTMKMVEISGGAHQGCEASEPTGHQNHKTLD